MAPGDHIGLLAPHLRGAFERRHDLWLALTGYHGCAQDNNWPVPGRVAARWRRASARRFF